MNDLQNRLDYLANKWESDVAYMSSDERFESEYYRDIIDMGRSVVPLLIKDLAENRSNPPHWFVALRELTDEDPVPCEHQGDITKMAAMWIEWGKNQGLV